MNINNELKDVLKTLSIDLDDRIIANINMYLDILFSWHEKNNILSTRDPSYFLKRDFEALLSSRIFLRILTPILDPSFTGLITIGKFIFLFLRILFNVIVL